MNVSGSIRKLTQLFVVLFIALSAGLVYWQVVVAQQVVTNPHNGRHCLPESGLPDSAARGRILDRNGVVLAESIPTFNGGACGYQRRYYLDKYHVPSLAGLVGYYISPFFDSTGVEHQYDDYLSGRLGVTSLNNLVNQTLHRPAVGDDIYLSIDVKIQAKLEQSFDADFPQPDNHNVFPSIRGAAVVSDPHTGEMLAMLSRPTFDSNCVVYCTLAQLQTTLRQQANAESADIIAYHGYDLCTSCSLDQFKTALQQHNYDPACEDHGSCNLIYLDLLNRDPKTPLIERPINSPLIPGSTYKTMTLLAGLDAGKIQMNNLFYNDHNPNHFQAIGPVTIGSGNESETFGIGGKGNNLEPYTTHFPVTLRYGYTHSDNIIFAQVGAQMIGANAWLEYNRRFYIGQHIPFDLPVAISTVSPYKDGHLPTNLLAEDSFGQGTNRITPLLMSLIDNAIANNGNLMRPSLIMKIVDPSGTTVLSNSPQSLGTPISDTTASQVRDGMYGVVQCGSGRFGPDNAALPQYAPLLDTSPYAIIAKTGTGEVGGGLGAHAWLITQAPYQNPQLTIVAMRENAGEAGSVLGPMVKNVYDTVFSSIRKIPAPAPVNSDQYCQQTQLLQ